MSQQSIIDFAALSSSELYVDTIYKGGHTTKVTDNPLTPLVGVGNVGGFRYLGFSKTQDYRLVVLYSSLSDPNWPDYLDLVNGVFTYYGDNKTPGQVSAEGKKGNRLLGHIFSSLHEGKRDLIPPFLIFTKGPEKLDVIFRGLAAPGAVTTNMTDDLIAVWKSREGKRFQNYRSTFTMLDEQVITMAWLEECKNGNFLGENCPQSWRKWVETGEYNALRAEPTIRYRSKAQQLPSEPSEMKIIKIIYEYFSTNPYSFEHFAASLIQMMDPNIENVELTRPWVDGGRDAVGKYRVGLESDPIHVEFAMEAKCYGLNNAVGIKETSRLISRLRYRQFGVIVTTSYVHHQAYKEIRDDQHPVIIISAVDIVNILNRNSLGNPSELQIYLNNFPL